MPDLMQHLYCRMYDLTFERMTHWYMHLYLVFWLSGKLSFQNKFKKCIAEFGDAIAGYRRNKLQSISEANMDSLQSTDEDSAENTRLCVVDRFLLSNQLDTIGLRNEIYTIFTSVCGLMISKFDIIITR